VVGGFGVVVGGVGVVAHPPPPPNPNPQSPIPNPHLNSKNEKKFTYIKNNKIK